MSSAAALEVLAALQALTRSGLAIAKLVELMQKPNITMADVYAALDHNDAAINTARKEN